MDFLNDVLDLDEIGAAFARFFPRYAPDVVQPVGRQFEFVWLGVIHSDLLAAFEPLPNVVTEREGDYRRRAVDQVAVFVGDAARRHPVHHEVLVAVRDGPIVLGRLPLGRFAERTQEVDVPAAERLVHRRVGHEHLAFLEVFGGRVHVLPRPGVRLGQVHAPILHQEVEHRRTAVVSPRPEMMRRRDSGHRERRSHLGLEAPLNRPIRPRSRLQLHIHVLIEGQSDLHAQFSRWSWNTGVSTMLPPTSLFPAAGPIRKAGREVFGEMPEVAVGVWFWFNNCHSLPLNLRRGVRHDNLHSKPTLGFLPDKPASRIQRRDRHVTDE